MQKESVLKDWIETNIDEQPEVKPHLLPTTHRYGMVMVVSVLCGYLQTHQTWPLWIHYFLVVGVAFILGVVQGLQTENERRHITTPLWHPLLRRLIGYQAICWTTALVLFLFGFDSWQNVAHFLAFSLAALLLCGAVQGAKYLLNTFSCPQCKHPYFGKGTKWEFVDGLLLFGMNKWPHTRCQHCNWPLWKPTDKNAQ